MSSPQNKAKKFPLSSGVYLFLDKNKRVLYIGRAVSLKRRVLNYFGVNIDPRIREMVALTKDLKYFKTDSLLEAVILEANLIKKCWPKYNVKDKDDRSFVYIAIDESEDFSKPVVLRGQEIKNSIRFVNWRTENKFKNKNLRIFGPYQSLSLVNNALKIIRRIFPYSTCAPREDSEKTGKIPKPCFNYQIGLCPGKCVGAISRKDYRKNMENIVLLLRGKNKKLVEKLKKENPDKAKALQHIQDVTLVSEQEIGNQQPESEYFAKRIEAFDISHLSGKETVGAMAVFINNEPANDQYRKFLVKTAGNNDLAALEEIIRRRLRHKEWPRPDFVLIDGGRPQVNHIFNVLKNEQARISLAGISKFGGDKLVFPVGTKKPVKSIIEAQKKVLLKLRDEAHRFAITFSRQKRKIKR